MLSLEKIIKTNTFCEFETILLFGNCHTDLNKAENSNSPLYLFLTQVEAKPNRFCKPVRFKK